MLISQLLISVLNFSSRTMYAKVSLNEKIRLMSMKNHTWQKLFSNASSQYTGPTVICKVTVSPSSPPFLFPHWWQRPAACAQHSVQLSWLLYSTNALGTLVLTSVQSISPANSTNTHSHTVANVNQLCCFSAMLIITNTEHLGSMGEIYANQIKS